MRVRPALTALVLAAAVAAAPSLSSESRPDQSADAVRVTVPRANVRDAPSESGKVVTQVTRDTLMELQAIEGDWYKVRLSLGGMRLEAYISKTVSEIVKAPAEEAAAAVPAAPLDESAATIHGMSVALATGESSTWLRPVETVVVAVSGRMAALPALASRTTADEPAAPTTGEAPVTFAWTLPAHTTMPAVTDLRPVFVVQHAEVPRVGPTRATADIVALTPTPAGTWIVSAVSGRADQAIWGDSDWDVMRSLLQQGVRTSTEAIGAGVTRVRPSSDLPPGRYAVVVRPATRDRLAGSDVLRNRAEGLLFAVAWPFEIR